MEKVSILGCGWYGLTLGEALVRAGYDVKGSTTSADRFSALRQAGILPYLVNISGSSSIYDEDFFDCDSLIISVPPKLRSGEHTEYLSKVERLVTVIKKHGIGQVIFVSSTGVFPETDAMVNEQTAITPNTQSSKTLLAAENLFRDQSEFLTTVLRFGGLVGPGRHPGRFFAGKTNIPNGQAPVNLIHLQDCIGITEEVLRKNAFGHVFNACSPHHPAKQEFYAMAAEHAQLPLPQFVDELNEWKIVDSINIPAVLGYTYKVNNWEKCFTNNWF